MTKGERVGVIFGRDGSTVSFLGYGIYEGEEVPHTAVGFLVAGMIQANRKNPKILLDSGKLVWGCECWWGPEDKIIQRLDRWRDEGFEIVDVDIDTLRAEYLRTEGSA